MRTILGCFVLAVLMNVQPAAAQIGTAAGKTDAAAPKADERVKKLLDANSVQYQIDSDGDFRMEQPIGDSGRTQIVFIRSTTETFRDLEIREIWSVGYKSAEEALPPDVANMLLADNAARKLGAWTKQGVYAVYVTQLAATADYDTLSAVLSLTVLVADAIEEQLSGDADAF